MNIKKIEELKLIKNGTFTSEQFIKEAKEYISATRRNKIYCTIVSVARSGMSRVLSFSYANRNGLNSTHLLLSVLDNSCTHYNRFRVSGCGMDMVFATHYDTIYQLKNLGFITEKTAEKLSQVLVG